MNEPYSKLYIAVLEDCPDFMVPTLVAHSMLGAHALFSYVPPDVTDEELFNPTDLYHGWLKDSFRKCVVKVNRKEFEKIKQLGNVYLGHENTTLGGEKSCAIPYPVLSNSIPNVLKFSKLWKPAAPRTIVYFDMDGVLADFNSQYIKHSYIKGNYPSLYEFSKLPKEEKDEIKELLFTYEFFRTMRPLTKGLELLKYYQEKYEKVVILSAAGDSSNVEEIERAKREWIKEHIGDIEVHIVDKAENKFIVTKQYPQFQNHMLIDDRKKAIDPWIDNGGIGILFV